MAGRERWGFFRLWKNQIGDVGVRALARAVKDCRTPLDLRYGARTLGRRIRRVHPPIARVSSSWTLPPTPPPAPRLARNCITDDGARSLAAALKDAPYLEQLTYDVGIEMRVNPSTVRGDPRRPPGTVAAPDHRSERASCGRWARGGRFPGSIET